MKTKINGYRKCQKNSNCISCNVIMSYGGCLIRGKNCVYTRFLVGSVLLIILVLCVVCVFVLYLLYSMSPVSLDFPFLIAPSVFSNVYLQKGQLSIGIARFKYPRLMRVITDWYYIVISKCVCIRIFITTHNTSDI